MRVLLTLAATLALATSPASAQQPARAMSKTERVLTRLEDGWARALVQRDTATFRSLLAPRFVYTEDAQVMGKEEVIRSVMGDERVDSAANEELKVHDFGNAAVVTGVLSVRGTGKNGPFTRRYRFTDTWLRRGGRWRMIAAQDYVMPK
jgi:ketosteroid isomerase-like protein